MFVRFRLYAKIAEPCSSSFADEIQMPVEIGIRMKIEGAAKDVSFFEKEEMRAMKKPQLVIFDVDGLMLDTESVWQKAWEIAGEDFGIDHLGTSVFLKVVGRNGKEVEEIVQRELSMLKEPLKVLDLAGKLGQLMLETELKKKAGLDELLAFLDDLHIPKAVATATSRKQTEERFERMHLLDRFDYLLCGDEVEKRKPEPDMYLKVLQVMKTKAEDALVLEDSGIGVLAAYRAKIPCIMVPDLILPQKEQYEQCIAIKENLMEVRTMLENLYVEEKAGYGRS